MKIKSIHKNDAYYPYRKQLIGFELVKSKTELVDSTIKGYLSGPATLRKKISLEGETADAEFYFLAVKVED